MKFNHSDPSTLKVCAIAILAAAPMLTGCTGWVHAPSSQVTNATSDKAATAAASPTPTASATPPGNSTFGVTPTSPTINQQLSQLVMVGASIIDDHVIDLVPGYGIALTANGNCNGKADAGETVEIAFNIVNQGSTALGPFTLLLFSDPPTPDITLTENLSFATWNMISPGGNWVSSIPFPRPNPVIQVSNGTVSNQFSQAYLAGLIGVKISATAHGNYKFILAMNYMVNGSTVQGVSFPFSLDVGTAPNSATACPGLDQSNYL
jgi:hypothetical protein